MHYNPAINHRPPLAGAALLSALKDQIIAWATAEVAKSTLSDREIARRAGFSPATLHRILGRDPAYTAMPKWQNVTALAKALGVKPPASSHGNPPEGLAEADAEPIAASAAPGMAPETPNQTVWQVKGMALAPMGYMPGDHFVLDQSVAPQNRDCVVAQVVDYDTGAAETVLRVYLDGFLVLPNYITEGSPRLFVDGRIVHIMGTIVRSWRQRRPH